ncbi:SHOCT domain-containing protein [Cytophaga hutchinsonii]|uniref:SHOCT domain-containing protein n=1 Tax=Cytophaga hutchinsonii (strain ATCC 33406 / DSM 1761 / CIP 103989 / NBRC 15051 / NCIMB 9469 / D465) TaxID=269798 RepID=A0A6N4SRS8_CYTH3|nr:SHOCT domain-containing protein [Cytophaga hutchinsonii]ABG59018.1 conserved hypothetical protein [Cytophaga hutchinsonii ATCC 33406]SFX38858.1 Short C-terminal domain-containing protein [Cytophaga hutchinsonii ATCC 33406]
MKALTQEGKQQIGSIASRYGISQDSVTSMLQAVINGGGRMAQFNIYELGGSGQWMQGGMTMVGDMFNHSLKNTVNNLCQELSALLSKQNIFETAPETAEGFIDGFAYAGNWWPSELGSPGSSGVQNNVKYAFFPAPVSRLAMEINGEVSVYNTLDHHISGVSQQQGRGYSVVFSSQYGNVDVLNLPLVSGPGTIKHDTTTPLSAPAVSTTSSEPIEPLIGKTPLTSTPSTTEDDIFIKIDKLGELFNKGILTLEEFNSKKAELLARL